MLTRRITGDLYAMIDVIENGDSVPLPESKIKNGRCSYPWHPGSRSLITPGTNRFAYLHLLIYVKMTSCCSSVIASKFPGHGHEMSRVS